MAASDPAYIVSDFATGRIIARQGDTEKPLSPCSTFKVPLALMGYNEGLLSDAQNPEWPYKEEYAADIPVMLDQWKKSYTPMLWMPKSCVWYSQEIVRKLGAEKFGRYVHAFDYGNRDVSGGLRSWLIGSLLISVAGQAGFLRRMLAGELPVSKDAVVRTTALIHDEGYKGSGRMYGKTGSGYVDRARDLQIGRYMGWVENGAGRLLFACALDHEGPGIGGGRARDLMRDVLAGLSA